MSSDTFDRLLTTLAVRIHAFAMCEIKAGWRLTFDPMDAVTIHYVLRGTGALRVLGGMDTAYAPCCIIVVPAGVPQSLGEVVTVQREANAGEYCGPVADGLVKFTTGDGNQDTLVVCATITASYGGALGLFDQLLGPVVEDLSQNETMRGLFALMLDEIAQPTIGTRALIEALMKQCLILMLRHHLLRLSVNSPFFSVLEDHQLARAIAGVLEHPSAPHTVDSLAVTAGLSRSVFAEKFTHTFHQTPIEFVQRVRLRLGARMLETTDLPVKVIATCVGYASRSYFTRAFRHLYGIDPKSYRTRAAGKDEIAQLNQVPSPVDRTVSTVENIPDDGGS